MQLPNANHAAIAIGFESAAAEYFQCAADLKNRGQAESSAEMKYQGVMVLDQAAGEWDMDHSYERGRPLHMEVIDDYRDMLAKKDFSAYLSTDAINTAISDTQMEIDDEQGMSNPNNP